MFKDEPGEIVPAIFSDEPWDATNAQCAVEVKELDPQIAELEQQMYSRDEFQKQLDALHTAMRNMEQATATEAISKEFMAEFIDKIFVTPENDHTARLDKS